MLHETFKSDNFKPETRNVLRQASSKLKIFTNL
jgi:hypothetical protein